MASTFDASHPVPIVATQEGIVQQAYAHTYDEKPALDVKSPMGEKDRSSSDVDVVALDGEDTIRESGMFLSSGTILSATVISIYLTVFWTSPHPPVCVSTNLKLWSTLISLLLFAFTTKEDKKAIETLTYTF